MDFKKIILILIIVIGVYIVWSSFHVTDVPVDPEHDYYLNHGLSDLGYNLTGESMREDTSSKYYKNGDKFFYILTGDEFLSSDMEVDEYNKTIINGVDGFINYDEGYKNYRFIHELSNGSYVSFNSKDLSVLDEVVMDYWN